MKKLLKNSHGAHRAAFTLVEMLVVIVIVAILMAILVPSLGKIQTIAESMKNISNMKQMVNATITFSTENGGKLPSPEYPGGIEVPRGKDEDDFFPEYWNLLDGSGKWLDGVVFGELYLREQNARADGENGDRYSTGGYSFTDDGEHLKGTVFESLQSVKTNPLEKDWHKHSYAMNKNLQYDRINDSNDSSDPYLTEKTLSNLIHLPSAMIYITCDDLNIVSSEDRQMIIDAIDERWGKGGKGVVGFLDGHVDPMRGKDIPEGNPETDRDASRFWRGVDEKR